jgi:hypothetical protein
MEKSLQNYIGFFFIAILVITLLGFYPSYFAHFPAFEGFTWAFHFHAFVATLWIVMLITQAFLIRAKRHDLHRKVAKASYIVIPLVLFSFYLMAKASYFKNINVNHLSEADALAGLSKSGLRDILYLAILYTLGILYKHRTPWHMRFFTCTGLMILGPGLGRFAFRHFSPEAAGLTMAVFLLFIPIIWLIVDIIKKKSPVPLLVFIAISISAIFLEGNGHAAWWQATAKWIADNLF